ncbi:MAG: metallophosphoesterase [Chitinophagales bacterium]|nr:metallophosphoesterase [Chitinophagales bacterium]
MRIAFITDLHIAPPDLKPYGVDAKNNFVNILSDVLQKGVDHVIIGGDLSYVDADEKVYQYIKMSLDRSGIPYSVISGNHDDSITLASVFGLQTVNGELCYTKKICEMDFCFMDTSTAFISEKQLAWLHENLLAKNEQFILVTHHPVLLSNVPFMDMTWPLKNHEAITGILASVDIPVFVFTGHYHIEKTVIYKNITQFTTPSLFFQINQYTQEFIIDHVQPAWRMIEWQHGKLYTTVHYLPAEKNAGTSKEKI